MKLILDFSWIISFFNSQFFTGLATILTGAVAYFIFRKQKFDDRLRVARIIMVEISDCETLFNSIKSDGVINLSNVRRLPFENSWDKYKHLFAKILDSTDLRLVDNFYGTCVLINQELQEAYSLPNHWREKGRIIVERHAEFSQKSATRDEYELQKKQIKFFEEDEYWWQPFAPSKYIIERIKGLQFITTTPTGEKLKKIAKL